MSDDEFKSQFELSLKKVSTEKLLKMRKEIEETINSVRLFGVPPMHGCGKKFGYDSICNSKNLCIGCGLIKDNNYDIVINETFRLIAIKKEMECR